MGSARAFFDDLIDLLHRKQLASSHRHELLESPLPARLDLRRTIGIDHDVHDRIDIRNVLGWGRVSYRVVLVPAAKA
jgi:hypothetical protein